MKLNNSCEVSPYTNPAKRLGALLNCALPSRYSGADGSERTIVLARNEGAPFIYGGPIDRAAIEQYNAIEVNGVPASVPNSEMVRCPRAANGSPASMSRILHDLNFTQHKQIGDDEK